MAQPFPFQAVISDMDGVIVDTEMQYWRELRAFAADKHLNVTVEELNAQVGMSHRDFQRMLKRWFDSAGIDPDSYDSPEDIFNEWVQDKPRNFADLLNPGARETIDALKDRGVRVALASSSPMNNIMEVLGACGLENEFEVIVSGEQFHQSKPNPEIYLHTLDVLGLPASACCCIEDSVPGITAGKRAGLTVIAKREERFGFSQAAADVIVDTLPDILTVGDKLGTGRILS